MTFSEKIGQERCIEPVPLVSCRDCRHFIPDKIGDGSGIGHCQLFEDYLKKQPSQKQINLALIKLGGNPQNPIFWGGTRGNLTRSCQRYQAIETS